jgi:pyridoxamine 5'-phosphate oxidase
VSTEVSYYENIQEIEKKIWSLLLDAVTNRDSSFRIPIFICGFQSDFDGRIVVLRKVDEANQLIQFHSDIRSDKIRSLKDNKNAAMVFYDKEKKIQLRFKVECIINYDNKITRESWVKTGHMSRKCYLVKDAPGTESLIPTSGLKATSGGFKFTMKESEAGYENFTVIQCKIKSIEWLYLAAKGHRRARIDYNKNKNHVWLVP